MNRKQFFIFLIKSVSLMCFVSCKRQLPSYRLSDGKRAFVCLKEDRNSKKDQGCWRFPACRVFCEDLFVNEGKRQMCYNWPMSLFADFRNLKDTIDTQSFEYIEPEVLKCFLKFVEDDKDILFKKLNEEESKELLEEIARNKTLAFHLAGEDKGDFSVLDVLFKKINSRIPLALSDPLWEGNNFLIFIHLEGNTPAWTWLNDYIIQKCRRDEFCKEPLDYYCKTLRGLDSKKLKDFFENQQFRREYEKRIESKICQSNACKYGNLQDFDEICDSF